jgi:hypothetical protein
VVALWLSVFDNLTRLFAGSNDGSVAMLEFDLSEFGVHASDADLQQELQKYKQKDKVIAESVEQLNLEDQFLKHTGEIQNKMEDSSQDIAMLDTNILKDTSSLAANVPAAVGYTNNIVKTFELPKQKESITKDGKKRIQPVFLQRYRLFILSSTGTMALSSTTNPNPKKVKPNIEIIESSNGINATKYTLPIIQSTKAHLNMALPAHRSTFTLETNLPGSTVSYSMECKNFARGCKLHLVMNMQQIWVGEYHHSALIGTITPQLVAISYADTSLVIYSLSGRK